MDVIGIDHVAIATEDVDETAALFEDRLGLSFGDRIEYTTTTVGGEQHLRGRLSNDMAALDLVEPRETDDNAVQQFLAEDGPGLYGLALRVRDVEAALAELEADGVEPVGQVERGEFVEFFFHPEEFGGVLVILAESPHPFESGHKAATDSARHD